VFVGDGMGKTVITGDLNADTPGISTFNTATVGAYNRTLLICIYVMVYVNILRRTPVCQYSSS
jgi:hypothetical protein